MPVYNLYYFKINKKSFIFYYNAEYFIPFLTRYANNNKATSIIILYYINLYSFFYYLLYLHFIYLYL